MPLSPLTRTCATTSAIRIPCKVYVARRGARARAPGRGGAAPGPPAPRGPGPRPALSPAPVPALSRMKIPYGYRRRDRETFTRRGPMRHP